jgi:hypothetical protein
MKRKRDGGILRRASGMKRFAKAIMLWAWRILTIPLALPVAIVLLLADEEGDMADRFASRIWIVRKG